MVGYRRLSGLLWFSNANRNLLGLPGQIEQASATSHPLPNDAAQAFVTDPPYYDAIPYGDLSDFFYVWMRRSLPHFTDGLLQNSTTPKDEEAIWNPGRLYTPTGKPKDTAFYESQMAKASKKDDV